MEKTIKELCEEKWLELPCFRPLYPCCWKLSYFGDALWIKDKMVRECNAED